MGDIAKGVLGGGWALLVGWILPAALNLVVFALAVAPSLRRPTVFGPLWPAPGRPTPLALLVAACLLGLVLNALQTPLYRLLEGYLLWPQGAYRRGIRVQKNRRDKVKSLTHGEGVPPIRRALLAEKLSRYPADDDQIAPSRLGNAIRRFETYGYDRYCLDTQVLWSELTSAAPEMANKQVHTARTNVDFFVALLYGHGVMAATAFASLAAAHANRPVLVVTALALIVLMPLWYRSAVAATDEWASAVRALVNLGRKPLADGLGLLLPKRLDDERAMWKLVTRMSNRPYAAAADLALAPYRLEVPQAAASPPPTHP
ncbi:hypothetical protein [Streptomyces sp. NPDC059349]|uniref:hypothetical protein n=1 Tax=Streptomyces sp. NPDC059349 TaxID=3346808 RepID=UPI003684C4C9